MITLRHVSIESPKVDTRSETATAVRAGTDTSLYLKTADTTRHVGQVHPEDTLTLGIIQGHFVDRHVDTGLVGTTDMKIGVPHSQTVITGDLQTGRGGQQVR